MEWYIRYILRYIKVTIVRVDAFFKSQFLKHHFEQIQNGRHLDQILDYAHTFVYQSH